jgi:nucleoside-diphosphate-sugar epimerase
MSRLVVWGAGELGSQVARLWRQNGEAVLGLTRSEQRHPTLRALGIEPQVGSAVEWLQPDDLLLLSLPGHETQGEALQHLRQSQTPTPARAVLISVTGYYGASAGRVDEETAAGEGPRSAEIAAVEQLFRQWTGEAGVILRLGGLYSAGRGPYSALARRKSFRLGPPDKTLALIHYDDAATVTWAALRHPAPEPVYLGVTPPCPTRQEFYREACRRLYLPAPIFSEPLDQPPTEYDVTRLRRDLLPQPAYPDWRAALGEENYNEFGK